MREYKRQATTSARMRLIRSRDGRLRSDSQGEGIADIWAEQKRIRLAEAILEDKRRAESKRRRKETLDRWKAKVLLRKKRAAPQPVVPKQAVVQGSAPKLLVSKIKKLLSKTTPKQRLFLAGGAIVLVVTIGLGALYPNSHQTGPKKTSVKTEVLSKKSEKPSYPTLLPTGISIEELGGWQRVSPQGKDPVFAYVDSINGVQINVSQQPLPQSFKQDTTGSIEKLAEQFYAKDKITVDELTAYVGTSEKGPQSVVLAKKDLLILIKSTEKIPNDLWGVYISSLK